jgi:3-hydroxybutyryl-CoA dehydrogenase
MMSIQKVGVVGCGLMGAGIAQVCAQAGYQTLVSEVNEELLQKGVKAISNSLERGLAKGRILKRDQATVLRQLQGTTNIEEFRDCDLVIESVVENLEEKKKVFEALDKICPPHTILATNTSCLSVTAMAIATRRPDKVIGAHFFNPVPVMTLLEIVTTMLTSDETVARLEEFGESVGKSVVLAKDDPGFIVNRLLVPFMLDAIRLLESGVATKNDIDASMVLGCNHPMGPLRLADFVGLDTVLYQAESMFKELKDPRFVPPLMLKRMVTARRLGRKAGEGFYRYD